MTNISPAVAKGSGLFAALALSLLALLAPTGASAGVATSGAVLLDPFDPVPEIQFRHYGGYDCNYECGGGRCDDGCGYHHRRHRGCDDGCYRHTDCDRDCGRRDHCDGDCDHHDHCRDHCGDHDGRDGDGDHEAAAPPCTSGHCSDTEHYEHHWRDGDHVGQEYYDRGRRERDLDHGGSAPSWYGHSPEFQDNDDDLAPPPAPPPPPPPPDHDHHDHHDH
jgi:hypothetical protein